MRTGDGIRRMKPGGFIATDGFSRGAPGKSKTLRRGGFSRKPAESIPSPSGTMTTGNSINAFDPPSGVQKAAKQEYQ